jgi:uncharacterized protein (TIGR02246 family)
MPASKRIAALAFAAAATAACAPSGGGEEAPPPVDLAAEEQAVRDLSMQWMEAYRAQDGATFVNLFAPDGASFFDGKLLEGREAILADMESNWSESPDFTIAWSTSSVEMAGSGDLAVERGVWEYDPDGPGEAEGVNGQYVTTWKKIDGQWQVIMDIGGVVNPEEAAEE